MAYKNPADQNEYARRRYRERKASGLCVRCGKAARRGGVATNSRCEEHLQEAAHDTRERNARRRANG